MIVAERAGRQEAEAPTVQTKAAAGPAKAETAKLSDVDPQAWLTDVFARIASLPQGRLHELPPWEWKRLRLPAAA